MPIRTYATALAAAVALSAAAASAGAQAPTPTATPTPVPTSEAILNAPTDIAYDFGTRTITWTDNATNEHGYRIHATVGNAEGFFTTGPNETSLQLPEDFVLPPCPPDAVGITRRPGVYIEILAYRLSLDGETGVLGIAADCVGAATTPAGPIGDPPPSTPTPIVAIDPSPVRATPRATVAGAGVRLPSTGGGSPGGGAAAAELLLLIAAGGVGAGTLGLMRARRP